MQKEETKTEAMPPLPVLTGFSDTTKVAPEWQIVATEFPLDANTFRNPVLTYSILRSPHRKGTLSLSEEGIYLFSRGVPAKSLWTRLHRIAAWVFYLVMFGAPILANVILRIPTYDDWQVPLNILRGVSFLCMLVFSLLTEYLRKEMTETVGWEQVIELQCEKQLRWANLIYRQGHPDAKHPVALTLNFNEPSQVGVLRDSIEHFVPGRTRLGVNAYKWTPLRVIAATVIVGGFVALLVWIFIVMGQRH